MLLFFLEHEYVLKTFKTRLWFFFFFCQNNEIFDFGLSRDCFFFSSFVILKNIHCDNTYSSLHITEESAFHRFCIIFFITNQNPSTKPNWSQIKTFLLATFFYKNTHTLHISHYKKYSISYHFSISVLSLCYGFDQSTNQLISTFTFIHTPQHRLPFFIQSINPFL